METHDGFPITRAAEAAYLAYVEGKTQTEIADRLGVSQPAVSKMLNKAPGSTVKEELATQAAHTHQLSWTILLRQLRTVIELDPDQETREETRDILNEMQSLTGGSETFSFEFESTDSTGFEIETSVHPGDTNEEEGYDE